MDVATFENAMDKVNMLRETCSALTNANDMISAMWFFGTAVILGEVWRTMDDTKDFLDKHKKASESASEPSED